MQRSKRRRDQNACDVYDRANSVRLLRSMQGCLIWKVVAALAVAGLAIWVFAPGLLAAAPPLLVVVACPLSMLFMMHGKVNMYDAAGKSPLSDDEALDDLRQRVERALADQEQLVRQLSALRRRDGAATRQTKRAVASGRVPTPHAVRR